MYASARYPSGNFLSSSKMSCTTMAVGTFEVYVLMFHTERFKNITVIITESFMRNRKQGMDA